MEFTWEVRETTQDVRDYTFQVFRSESPEGPWDPVTDVFEDKYLFKDERVPGGTVYRKLYYRLHVVRKADASFEDFGPAWQEAEPDLVATYIRKSEQTLFTQATGRQCWVFPRRTFGTFCPSCYDKKLGKTMRSSCPDCYCTGFLRGYLDPIACWIQIDPTSRQIQLQSLQKDQQNLTAARMSYYPLIKPDDMVVEIENTRWRVVSVQPSERLRTTIKQELAMRMIMPSDIEMKIPINITELLRDIQPSPPRMFSNPVNLDNIIDERVPNAFAIYDTYPKNGG